MQFPRPISAAPLPLWTPLTPAQNFRKAEKIPHAENLRRVNGSNQSVSKFYVYIQYLDFSPKHPQHFTGPNNLKGTLTTYNQD